MQYHLADWIAVTTTKGKANYFGFHSVCLILIVNELEKLFGGPRAPQCCPNPNSIANLCGVSTFFFTINLCGAPRDGAI